MPFKQRLFASCFPGKARDGAVRLLESRVVPTVVQVPLELGNVPLLAVVAAHLVEDLDEHSQQRVDLCLADHIRLLVDVEEDALGRNGGRSLEITAQNFVVSTLFKKQIEHRPAIDPAVFEQKSQHLE